MAKTVKKVDAKKVAKAKVMEVIAAALEAAGMKVIDGEAFGMTAGTVVVRTEKCDVQLKPITPKAGLDFYEELEVEEEEVVEETADPASNDAATEE